MLLLGLDCETTGLDVVQDYIIEISTVLWDTNLNRQIEGFSMVINHPQVNEIPPQITDLTGLTIETLKAHGKEPERAFSFVLNMIKKADYLVAHNAHSFDRPILENHIKRILRFELQADWIDTMTDIPYPKHIRTRALNYLLADHGMINCLAHQASTDTLFMMQLLSKYDIDKVVQYASAPSIKIRAHVSKEDRQKAKDRFFQWHQEPRMWIKTIKQFELDDERKACDFEISIVEGLDC